MTFAKILAALGAAPVARGFFLTERGAGLHDKKLFRPGLANSNTLILLAALLVPGTASAGLLKPDNTPLEQFGFATGPEVRTLAQFNRYYDVTRSVLGSGGIVRTGLGWDPTRQNVPGFEAWSETVLDPARARGITVLPGIKTLDLDRGGYRWPTDSQWTHGLRQIVRMYGPGGVYAKGGTYVQNGRTIRVPAHAGFAGLTDYELWNEPNSSTGDLRGTMTPAKMAHLLKIGAAAMRDEAAELGFRINIVGPAVGGMEVDYIAKLWQADYQVFRSIDTLSIHAYSRLDTSACSPGIKRCIKSLKLIRDYLDSHGGAHVHIANTEGGYAGDKGTCLGPQVLTEAEQSAYSEEALKWLRANPGLDVDFWITYHAIDDIGDYSFGCTSGIYDNTYWKKKLGVVRADLSLKPWGIRLRELTNSWR